MLRVGLTGGIGCGKSIVAAMMGDLGCHIINADRLAHRLIEPGEAAYDDVVREFGPDILDASRRVDRPRLAAIVFADAARLARLNTIVHPRVLAETEREFDVLEQADPAGVAVVEAALLVEAGYHRRLDRLVFVFCTPDQQLERLTNHDSGRGMNREQAAARIASQMSLEEKRKLTHCGGHELDEIDCSATLEATRAQAAELVTKLKRLAATSNKHSQQS